MSITAVIEGIQYQTTLRHPLKTFSFEALDVNKLPACCIIQDRDNDFALSKWVSPKRTRSYPYARVYDSLQKSKRATIIPIVKDEGIGGDRDFIQWDTISLMSLLEVYVIFGYYNQASCNARNPNKITNQQFDKDQILLKMHELLTYQSSALHWNLKELRESLPDLVDRQIDAYQRISVNTGVQLKSTASFYTFKEELQQDISVFIESSRQKAEKAQYREVKTIHAGEFLETITKASITITNYIGGKYFFTVDEVTDYNGYILLSESKNTNSTKLPKNGDIKDGLLKMILYKNLSQVYWNGNLCNHKASLKLTSPLIRSSVASNASAIEVQDFLEMNKFSRANQQTIHQVFREANLNQFIVQISQV